MENIKTPIRAKFRRIIESDGYKFIPANRTAEKFCDSYGTRKIAASEFIRLRVEPAQIQWG